jgi:dienelactone hydrolase
MSLHAWARNSLRTSAPSRTPPKRPSLLVLRAACRFKYEGTQHAFHNDTAGTRYDKDAAELAWRRTVEFLHAALGS